MTTKIDSGTDLVLLTERELAERWKMNPGTFRVQRARGRSVIPYIKIGGSVRYRLGDITAYEEANLRAR